MHTRDEKINYNFYYVMKNPLQWHCLWEQVNSVDANSVWKNLVLGRLSWVNSVGTFGSEHRGRNLNHLFTLVMLFIQLK